MSDTLPKGWKWVKLGEIAEIKTGKTNSQDADNTGDYPLFDRSSIIKRSKKFLFNTEAVIVPGEGKEFIPRYYNGKFDLHQRAYAIFNFKRCIPKFIYYNVLLNKDIFKSFATGSTVLSLRLEHFLNFPILLPPLPEQKSIAEVLSSIDDKIELLHRQNKTLEEMAMTLFRQWFIEPTKDGLPEGWKMGYLADEFDITMGQSPPGETLNEEKIGMVFFQGGSDFCFRFPVPRVYTTAPTRIAKPLDTLVSVRAPVGDINMAFEECCLGRGVAAFRYKQTPEFYSYTYYKMRSLTEQIKLFEDYGTVFGSIGKENFKKLDCFIPPIEMILKYEENAKPFDDKIISNTKQIRTLEKLRDTLLPKLMSGEVRVKV